MSSDIERLTSDGIDLEHLETISKAIADGYDLRQILELIAFRTNELLEVQQTNIYLKEGEYLQLKASTRELPAEPVLIKSGEGVEGRVVQYIRPLIIDSKHSNAHLLQAALPEVLAENEIFVVAAMPIVFGSLVLGVISIEQLFTTTEFLLPSQTMREMLPLLSVMADLVSLALENSQILQRQQRRTQLIELLHRISNAANEKKPEELISLVSEQIRETTGAQKVDIMLLSRETDELVRLGSAVTSLSRLEEELGFDHIPLGTSGRLGEIFRNGGTYNGPLKEGDFPPGFAEKTGIHSALIVPLQIGTERQGIVTLYSANENAFDDDDLKFISFISTRLSYSLHYQELNQELSNAEMERIDRDDRDNFIAIVAHDLKNALTAIRGNSQLGLRRLSKGDYNYSEKALSTISSRVIFALQLVNDMVDINQIEKGSFRLYVNDLDLIELIGNEVETLRATAPDHIIEFHTDFPSFLIKADAQRLTQVFNNLLTNALRYSSEESTVRIAILSPATFSGDLHLSPEAPSDLTQSIIITISDEGIGIPAKDLPYIFDRFYRGSGAIVASGSGLGLYITREIIRQHGGNVWVESVPQQGSRFYVSLPYKRTS